MKDPMPKATIASPSSPSPVPATWLARRTRSPRVNHKTSIPPIQSEVVMDSVKIQLQVKLQPNKRLEIEVCIDDEPQEVVDSEVKNLRIDVSKLKTIGMLVPSDPDTGRLLSLADVCCKELLALPDVSSPSHKL